MLIFCVIGVEIIPFFVLEYESTTDAAMVIMMPFSSCKVPDNENIVGLEECVSFSPQNTKIMHVHAKIKPRMWFPMKNLHMSKVKH